MGFFNGTELKHNISRDELNKIISEHQIWLKHGNKPDESGKYGKQADLAYAILTATNQLSGVDLSKANLQGAILDCADLSYTNLSGANLTETSFKYCNFKQTNISDSIGWNTANWLGTDTNSLILSSPQIRQKLNRLKGLIDKQINELNLINENNEKDIFLIKKHQLHRLEKLQLIYQEQESQQINNEFSHILTLPILKINIIEKYLLNLTFNNADIFHFKILTVVFFLWLILLITKMNVVANLSYIIDYIHIITSVIIFSIMIPLALFIFIVEFLPSYSKVKNSRNKIITFLLLSIFSLLIFPFIFKYLLLIDYDYVDKKYIYLFLEKYFTILYTYTSSLAFLFSFVLYKYNEILKNNDTYYCKTNKAYEEHKNLHKIAHYYHSVMNEKNNEINLLRNKIKLQEGQLDLRIKSARETLSKALVNADNGIQNNSEIAKKCGNMGMALFVLDFAFIFGGLIYLLYLSWTMLHIDVNSLPTVSKSLKDLPSWLVLLYTFPIVATMLIANALLRHQKKLLDEVRHFSAMKHQIELYSGLLEASQYAADSFNSKESASAYVEETFTRIRDRLLSENAPQSTNLSDSDKDELSDLMKKVLDNHIINQLGISSNKKEDKNDKDDKDDKKKDDEN